MIVYYLFDVITFCSFLNDKKKQSKYLALRPGAQKAYRLSSHKPRVPLNNLSRKKTWNITFKKDINFVLYVFFRLNSSLKFKNNFFLNNLKIVNVSIWCLTESFFIHQTCKLQCENFLCSIKLAQQYD